MTRPRRPVVGIVGNDVPRQLVLASGATPHRVTGSWTGDVDPVARDLLGAADAVAGRILSQVRAGRLDCDALVVCADSQANVRLFYVLRSIAPELPLHLVDLPRAPSTAARRFARFQFAGLVAFLTGLTGQALDAAALARSADAERALGSALERLRARRRAEPPQCSGALALEALLDAARLDPADAVVRVDGARSDVPQTAVRVHLTGSSHPDAGLYRALEEQGCVIVSEDHDTGDGAWLGVAVDAATVEEAIDGLVDRHFDRVGGSATASSAARALLTRDTALLGAARGVGGVIRELDEAPAWDVPDQAELLGEIGVALHVQTRVHPGDELRAVRELARDLTGAAAA
ncbi:2-hydroxyacyl-CoA dehydratase family protein [Microbacterium cremeum]|uniref:2-hydroxyacyl-CoA dehydratase family protein n=1 Tax=Microbacterium cremeum TaxID=2782169 RepID=UPI001888D9CB|nr:2-hydroxyacyl-CoA dehydratase family protein [Microbacterium cremeum]